ncbi:UNVERIFIED_CONTAM: hypothetical protein K2H54_017168 [Gekko kuhli]
MNMAQTSLAASTPPDSSLSSVFLVNLSNLVESISLPPKRSREHQLPETTVHISQSAEGLADDSDPILCPEDPHRKPIPQTAVKEHRRDLDEQLEETEREIKALVEFWENCFVDEKEDNRMEIPWISKWPLGSQLDLNDECLQEDPSYNKERVEQEALEDYHMELEEQRAPAPVEQTASPKQDAATSDGVEDKSPPLPGKRIACTKALASLSQGRPPTHKMPCVIQRVTHEAESTREEAQEESGSPSSSSEEEEEEAAVLLRKRPKRNLRCRASGMGKTQTGKPRDRSEQLQRCKQKVSRHCRRSPRQLATDQSSEKSETSSSGKGQPSKPYNFRRQRKQVSYVSQQEEEEEEERSWSEGRSENDWLPEEEESDAEAEEDTEDMEVEEEEDEEAEREEESEAAAGPTEAEPQGKNRRKTVRSYRCPECDQEFSNSSNMQKHLLVHRGERPYGCHVCGKSFAHPSNLTKHQVAHTGERNHLCPLCPKAFFVKNHLDSHVRRHQGVRPFPCLECPSTFCSRVDLLLHMKIHMEGKGSHRSRPPVRCTDCNKTFPGPMLLRRHQKRHKMLVCKDCGEVFDLKRKYKFHRSLHVSCACVQCGVNYTGTHLCQGPAQDAEQLKRGTRKSSASVPQGVEAKQPAGRGVPAGSQKQPVGSTQAATWSSGTDRPSTDGPVRPSYPACVMSLKEPSPLARTDAGTSQRSTPLIPVACPVLDHRRAEPSTPAQTPLQMTPAGIPCQDVPIISSLTSSPATAKPFAHAPVLPGPPSMVTLLSHSQAPVAFPVLAAAPTMTGSQPKPLIVSIPVRPPQPSGSNPVSGAANNSFILRNSGTLSTGNKIVLENSSQEIVPSITTRICAVCQAKYLGAHRCRKPARDRDPHCELIPQMAPKGHRRDLDKLLEETEREIKALMEFWENCFVDEKEDSSREIPWINKWHLGHPLDLNDECLGEDPSYNEERVEQEALKDYLKELEEQRAHVAVKQPASQKRGPANPSGVEDKSPSLPGKLTACAKALASLSRRRPPSRRKPYGIILSVADEAEVTREEAWEESGSPSSSSEEEEEVEVEEEEEAAILLRKTPKRNFHCRASRTGKTHTGKPLDRSEQLWQRKQKVSRHCHWNSQQPVAGEQTPSVSYPFSGLVDLKLG